MHSTWVSGNTTRLHADFTPIVILGVTVRLVSKFLCKCPGYSDFGSRQVTSTQCRDWTSRFMVENVMALISQLFLIRIDRKFTFTATSTQYATASTATQNRLSRPHLDAVTSIHQLRRRTQRSCSSNRQQSCQLHHLIIAPSTHHKTARNSHVVTSRAAQSNLSRFQHWLTQTFPVCQRHHVFLSTRVHDHI